MALQNARLFNRKPKIRPARPEVVDTAEQRRVHANLGIVARHLRRDLALQSLNPGIGMGTGPIPEQGRHSRKRVTCDLQRNDRVCESRRFRILRDRIDFCVMLLQRHFKSRCVVVVADLLELRQAKRPLPIGDGGIENRRLNHVKTS